MPIPKKVKKKGDSDDPLKLSNKDLAFLRKAVELVESIKKKQGISYEQILELLKEEKERIPVTIFNKRLSPLESISRYLKDELKLNYHEIAVLLGRDERNIWHSYNNSLKKHPAKLLANEAGYHLPLKIFAERKFSILESIVVHLRERGLSYKKISALIQRNERTVWTVYSRAKRKMNGKACNAISGSRSGIR